MTAEVLHGDCLDILPSLASGSIDAAVTDPPYSLGFMGKDWDSTGVAFQPETWDAVLRVLNSGGYMLAFGGTRTYHRLACAIEYAGFEIRDCLMWVYGSGFPKGKGCLKPAWEPILLARKPGKGIKPLGIDACRIEFSCEADKWVPEQHRRSTSPHPMEWGKNEQGSLSDPKHGRWPANLVHDGSEEVLEAFAAFAENGQNPARFFANCPPDTILYDSAKAIMKVCQSKIASAAANNSTLSNQSAVSVLTRAVTEASHGGITLSDCQGLGEIVTANDLTLLCKSVITATLSTARSVLPEQRHDTPSPTSNRAKCAARIKPIVTTTITISRWKSDGSADPVTCVFTPTPLAPLSGAQQDGERSRFHYCAKASKQDRDEGLEGMPEQMVHRAGHGNNEPDHVTQKFITHCRNHHPTVKPTTLMRWLCRLITPPGGKILDPFAGSGSTGKAAVMEGFDFVGIEREAEYVEIARRRIAAARAECPLFAGG